MPNTDPRTRRRADDQYDYEDPIDRYRPPDDRPKVKKKLENKAAAAAYTWGLISLVPCLGAVLGPVAITLGLRGLAFARAQHPPTHPITKVYGVPQEHARQTASGRGRTKSGIWFGLLACFINYGLPALFFVLAHLR